jgi:hypothetical protein
MAGNPEQPDKGKKPPPLPGSEDDDSQSGADDAAVDEGATKGGKRKSPPPLPGADDAKKTPPPLPFGDVDDGADAGSKKKSPPPLPDSDAGRPKTPPPLPEDEAAAERGHKIVPGKSKNFSCTNCGASVTMRNPGQTFSVACESCYCVMDTSTPAYRILTRFYEKAKRDPLIPLGTRGKLFEREWEVIGFVVRRDVRYGVQWEEYLLFNPYYGYRWLQQNSGHWNFTTPIKDRPNTARDAEYQGQKYKLYYSDLVEVDFVLGEFYWKLKSGDAVRMKDFICPPYMLSCELDEREKNWSHTEYVKASEIKQAFKLDAVPYQSGMAPNQPSDRQATWKAMKWQWVGFLFLLFVIQVGYANSTHTQEVISTGWGYVPNSKSTTSVVSPKFQIPKNHNLELIFNADVDNSWFYYAGELVNDDTDQTWPLEGTMEYYHGYDSDGSWQEGSHSESKFLNGIPAGPYYMTFDWEHGDAKGSPANGTFSVGMKTDVPQWWGYWMAVVMVSMVPLFYWLSVRGEEVTRWRDSDYTPYVSSSEE